MSKVDPDPRLPTLPIGSAGYAQDLNARLTILFRQIAQQINAISEGSQVAFYTSLTSAPTSGAWFAGDFILNSAPSESGSAGSKYIIHGWRCVASGSPGTWVQCRYLTGN